MATHFSAPGADPTGPKSAASAMKPTRRMPSPIVFSPWIAGAPRQRLSAEYSGRLLKRRQTRVDPALGTRKVDLRQSADLAPGQFRQNVGLCRAALLRGEIGNLVVEHHHGI